MQSAQWPQETWRWASRPLGLVSSRQPPTRESLEAAREKALLEKVEKVEQMFNRNQVEKAFIEERFIKLDSDSAAPAGVLPKPPDEIAPA